MNYIYNNNLNDYINYYAKWKRTETKLTHTGEFNCYKI